RGHRTDEHESPRPLPASTGERTGGLKLSLRLPSRDQRGSSGWVATLGRRRKSGGIDWSGRGGAAEPAAPATWTGNGPGDGPAEGIGWSAGREVGMAAPVALAVTVAVGCGFDGSRSRTSMGPSERRMTTRSVLIASSLPPPTLSPTAYPKIFFDVGSSR